VGVGVDHSAEFFGALTGEELRAGHFGVANCFVPKETSRRVASVALVGHSIAEQGFELLLVRDVPVDHNVTRPPSGRTNSPSHSGCSAPTAAHRALLVIEAVAYADDTHAGLYPLSLSARKQVLKGRLNSGEVIGYFKDLNGPRHSVRSLPDA